MIRLLKPHKVSNKLVIAIPYIWLILFFLFPFFILLKISLSEEILAIPPYTSLFDFMSGKILQIRLNLGSYLVLASDNLYVNGFMQSILIAGFSTAICLIIGYPMAYAIARSSTNIRPILQLLVILPFWTSFLIRVYSWIVLLSPMGLINTLLIKLGLITLPLPLINNSYAVCLGIVYAYLPFMVLPLCICITKIDFSLLEAAYDLGCSPIRAFFSIILPLSTSGMIAGSILVFIPAIGEYVIPELLGGPDTLTIGRIVWNEFFHNLSWPTASAIAVILVLFVVLPISFWQRWNELRTKEE